MKEVLSYLKRDSGLLLTAILIALAVVMLLVYLTGLLSQRVGAQTTALSPSRHPAGTRILESCTAKVPADECVTEKVVMDWSPSGRFVKLAAVGFITPGEWKLPRQVRIVELLAVPKSEPAGRKLPEMVLEGSGRVRRDWQ